MNAALKRQKRPKFSPKGPLKDYYLSTPEGAHEAYIEAKGLFCQQLPFLKYSVDNFIQLHGSILRMPDWFQYTPRP